MATMRQIKNRKQMGFTLLELLVVLGIIAMLAGIVGPQVMKHMGESKTKAAKVQLEDLASTLDMYKLDAGTYPSTEQGLNALIEAPDNARQHGKFDIFSYGADGKEGGTGEDQDIVSWE